MYGPPPGGPPGGTMVVAGARGVPAASQVLANTGDGFACLSPGVLNCAGCNADDLGSGLMTLVGTGSGDYVAETTYRYVGNGQGDLTFVQPPHVHQSSNRGYMVAGVVMVLVMSLAAVLLWPLPPAFSTTVKTAEGSGRLTCRFWGDPHVETFDGARPSFYGEGEFWIIKSRLVQIQGRYVGTKDTDGLASVNKLMIGGPFLENHVIEIEPMLGGKGQIQIDNRQVLKYIMFQHDLSGKNGGLATIRYDRLGQLIDEAQSSQPRNVLHLNLPEGLAIKVFRWENHLDIEIEMEALKGGQDGSCGNFNGDPSDDTTEAIFQRVGARVDPADLLFAHRVQVDLSDEMNRMLDTQCAEDRKQEATGRCQPLSGETLRACVFDWCFGMNEHALREAKALDR